MVDFPIFEEIKNFIYVNIEYILLIIAPLTTLILFLANKVNQRIESEQDESRAEREEIIKIITKIDERLTKLEDRFNKFELKVELELQALKLTFIPKTRRKREEN